ncbi:DNA internalization-related competence protein ComEC/Rec2 [candidate division KSB1 bacterium]
MDKIPCLKTVIFLIFGIIIERYVQIPLAVLFLFTPLFLTLYFFTPVSFKDYTLILCIVIFGMLRYGFFLSESERNYNIYKDVFGKYVELSGRVKDKREYFGEKSKYIVEVNQISINGAQKSAAGKILVNYFSKDSSYRYGQNVSVYGRLLEPRGARNPGEFNYKGYLRNKGVYGIINVSSADNISFGDYSSDSINFVMQIVERLKYGFSSKIKENFSGQERELLRGLLLGEREGLDPAVKDEFSRSGILHILAVSGLHVGFIIFLLGLVIGLFRIPNFIKYGLIVSGIILYVLLTGARPPVMRASVLAGIVLIGFLMERRVDTVNSVGAAGLLLLLFRPDDLFSASFQLSFTAVFGIIFITYISREFIDSRLKGLPRSYRRVFFRRYIVIPLLVSLGIVIFISPVSGYYFGRISPIAIPANLIVIPLTFCIVGLGFFILTFGNILAFACEPFAAVLHYSLKLLIGVAHYAGTLPFAYVDISREVVYLTGILYFLVYLCYHAIRNNKKRRIAIYFLVIINILIWDRILFHPAGELKVVFFDVGQGDSALLQLPDDRYMLIDGGRKSFGYDSGLYTVVPYLKRNGIKYIDKVVLSHPDADHIGGIQTVINSIPVGIVYESAAEKSTLVYSELAASLTDKQISRQTVSGGMQIGDSDYYRIYVLHPPNMFQPDAEDVNNYSLVIMVVYGDQRFLFTGDIEVYSERKIERFDDFLRCSVLKVAHHGSRGASSEEFLQRVKPEYAVISAGEYNRYNLPHPSVIERLNNVNAEIIRTDKTGAAVFKTNGEKLVRVK